MQPHPYSSANDTSEAPRPGPAGLAKGVCGCFAQRSLRRFVCALLLLTLAPAVTATLVCDVHCLAQALAGSADVHGASDSHGVPGELQAPAFASQPLDDGPCHLAAHLVLAGVAATSSSAGPIADEWIREGPRPLASIAWPPPRPRPKSLIS